MMKLIFIFYIISISILLTSQNIIINEIMQNPAAVSDSYGEWFEIYNLGTEQIDLINWEIKDNGSNHHTISNSLIIESGEYIVLGNNADFQTNGGVNVNYEYSSFSLGNSDDEIILISPEGTTIDSVAWDDGVTFPDPSGASMALLNPELDNSIGSNWQESVTPYGDGDFGTPGTENIFPIDLAIYELNITEIEGVLWLETEVFNLSTEIVHNSEASLEITINNSLFNVYDLPEILPESYIDFSCELGLFPDGYYVASATVNYIFDNNLENNSASNSILIGSSPLVLNEVMFKPAASNHEWIEIFNRSASGYLVDNFQIIDASGGQISFSGSLESQDFLVVCQYPNLLLEIYPEANPDKIVEAECWTALNNTEESLKLVDQYETKFDSTSYEGSNCPTNFSIERVNPFIDENIVWEVCQDSIGATPTLPNSVLPAEKDLILSFISYEIQDSQIEHTLIIQNIGLENITDAVFICSTILDDDISETEIYQQEITISDSLLFTFITEIPPIGYITFKYEIISIEDLNEDNNVDFSFYNNNALPFVINEIMYAPNEGEPEWLEMKINYFIVALEEFFLIVDEDTLSIPFSENEYILITHSNEDVQFLQSNYDLEDVPIFTGLGFLSNNGEQISIIDECDNLIESFFYISDWNDDLKGVSIERVNPTIMANPENWGPAVSVCTPGTQNSVFVQVLPSKVKLSVNPNPFSPYQSERTIFSFKLPEKLSRVTIRIFDLKGRLVKKLIDQTLQASEGDLIWDGRGDNGKNLPIGVYIVLLEATSRESEKVYAKKTTVVIGKN